MNGPVLRSLQEAVEQYAERFWEGTGWRESVPADWVGLVSILEVLMPLLDPQPVGEEGRRPRAEGRDEEAVAAAEDDLDAALEELAGSSDRAVQAAAEAAIADRAMRVAAAEERSRELDEARENIAPAAPAPCPWGCGRWLRTTTNHYCYERVRSESAASAAVAEFEAGVDEALEEERAGVEGRTIAEIHEAHELEPNTRRRSRSADRDALPLALCDWCHGGFVDIGAHRSVCEARPRGGPDCVHHWRLDRPAGDSVRQECVHCGAEKTVSSDPPDHYTRDMAAKRKARTPGHWQCACGFETRGGPAISAHKRECQAWRVPAVAR